MDNQSWIPEPKRLKVGDHVRIAGIHPRKGEIGTVIHFQVPGWPGINGPPTIRLSCCDEIMLSNPDDWEKL